MLLVQWWILEWIHIPLEILVKSQNNIKHEILKSNSAYIVMMYDTNMRMLVNWQHYVCRKGWLYNHEVNHAKKLVKIHQTKIWMLFLVDMNWLVWYGSRAVLSSKCSPYFGVHHLFQIQPRVMISKKLGLCSREIIFGPRDITYHFHILVWFTLLK